MRVSVAMCTYNGEKYLQEQLDSILQQSRQPDEMVVCEDASSDGTLDILQSFRKLAPFDVRVYTNDSNLGYVKNLRRLYPNVMAISSCAVTRMTYGVATGLNAALLFFVTIPNAVMFFLMPI